MGAKYSRHNIMMHNERRASLRQAAQAAAATASNSNTTTATEKTNTSSSKQQHGGGSSVSYSTNSIVIDGRQYHNVDSSTYCLPRDELEQDRLNSQHFALKAFLEGNVLPSVNKLIPSHPRVLDLGCGSGCWVMEMAIEFPEYQVTGLDMADMFPTTIVPENVSFDLHNVLDGLPYPDNSFDFIHMRLMIVALRSTEWPFVLNEIFRVLKPGGLVQLVESDFTESSDVQIVNSFNKEFLKTLQETGQDPWIAPKLSKMLTDMTFDIMEVQEKYLSYGLPLNPIARESLINWKSAMLSLKPLLASRLSPTNTDLYNSIVDRYIEGIKQAGWKIGVWAICAQKPKKQED